MLPIPGRLISKAIYESDSFASLTPNSQTLFMLVLTNLNSHGKMEAAPSLVKASICKKLKRYNAYTIKACLEEISRKTDVKFYQVRGRWYIHALNFHKYQPLRIDRRGVDHLPGFWESENAPPPEPIAAPRTKLEKPASIADLTYLFNNSGTSSPGVVPESIF